MRRLKASLAIAALSIAQLACQEWPTGATETPVTGTPVDLFVVGTYVLTLVDGAAVPLTFPDSSKVTSGVFVLNEDHSWARTVYYQAAPPHAITYYGGDGGTWIRVVGDTLKFTSNVGPPHSVNPVVYSKGKLIEPNGARTYVYER